MEHDGRRDRRDHPFEAAGITPDDVAHWGGRVDDVDYNTDLSPLRAT